MLTLQVIGQLLCCNISPHVRVLTLAEYIHSDCMFRNEAHWQECIHKCEIIWRGLWWHLVFLDNCISSDTFAILKRSRYSLFCCEVMLENKYRSIQDPSLSEFFKILGLWSRPSWLILTIDSEQVTILQQAGVHWPSQQVVIFGLWVERYFP